MAKKKPRPAKAGLMVVEIQPETKRIRVSIQDGSFDILRPKEARRLAARMNEMSEYLEEQGV